MNQDRTIYRDNEGNLYYVEYDEYNNPYKVYCDEYGNPINYDNYNSYQEEDYVQYGYYEQNNQQNYKQDSLSNSNHNNYTNYEKQPKKKKSKWWLWLFIVLLLVGGGIASYIGYNYFKNKEVVIDVNEYELNFVTLGNDGEGNPNIDILKIPNVNNLKENQQAIEEYLKNPEVIFDKNEKLKNGDKVKVELKLNEYTAKKYKLKITGKLERTYTVAGLVAKKDESKEDNKEQNNKDKSSSNNKEKNRSEVEQKAKKFLDEFRSDVSKATLEKDASYIQKYFYSTSDSLYLKLKEVYEVLAVEENVTHYESKSFHITNVAIRNNRYIISVHFVTDVHYKNKPKLIVDKTRDYILEENNGRLYLVDMTNL